MAEVRALLTAAAARLAAAGVGSPRVDAELLLAARLGVTRGALISRDRVPDDVVAQYEADLDRRAAREPLQHITGRAPFRNLDLAVGPGVFVPRPETELLVDAVLAFLDGAPEPLVVDLCSGSGALALAVAGEVPGAHVVAVERSTAATPWLYRNASGTAVQVVVADIRDPDPLRTLDGRADVVVCNPPYVPSPTGVEAEVRADPPDAVFAGADGLDLMPAVIERAATLLRAGGLFAVEHDDSQGTSVPALVEADGRFDDVADHRDLSGRDRFTTARRCTRHR